MSETGRGPDESADRVSSIRGQDESAERASSIRGQDESAERVSSIRGQDESAERVSSIRGQDESAERVSSIRGQDESAERVSSIRGQDKSAERVSSIRGQDEIAARVSSEIDRAIKRNIKGLEFLTAPKQAVGAMAKDTLLRRGTLQLYHYRPVVDEVYRIPILLVSPTSNRGYVFDLARGQSFVEFLLTRGYDVFMIDWLPPRREESGLKLEDYLLDFIPMCVAHVREHSGQPDVTLIGYCIGGTLALLYAALFPSGIANLLLFTTPVDFRHMALFRAWGSEKHFDVDRLVDALGNIPGEFILSAFDIMRPANRTAGMLHLWTNMWNDDYVKSYRMFDRWSAETLPLAGEYFRQSTKEFLWRNSIISGELTIGGRRVELSKVTAPVLSIVAQHDHVVPQPSAHPIMELVGSTDREELLVKGGHVSVIAGPSAVTRLWPSLDRWLAKRSV